MIDRDKLMALLHYDPETGVFTWIAKRRPGVPSHKIAGHVSTKGYVVIVVDGRAYKAHRLAWLYVTGCVPSGQIDHVNKIKNDNRWTNLRDVSGIINQQNRNSAMATSSTKMLGAFKHGSAFCSKIRVNGKQVYLGVFATAKEAHLEYLKAKDRCHEGYVP